MKTPTIAAPDHSTPTAPWCRGWLLLLALGSLLAPRASALSTLPFYEPFATNYTDGGNLGTSANGSSTVWDAGASAGPGLVVSNLAVLNYSGLATSNGSRGLVMSSTGTARNRGASFTSQSLTNSNPTVYFSFLLNIQTAPTAGNTRSLAYLRADASSGTPHFGIWMNSSSQLLIGKNTTSPTATTAALSAGTHLIVARYKFVNGSGNDIGDIWIDPGSLGEIEANVPGFTLSVTNGSDQGTIASLILSCPGNSSGGIAFLDELRVGLTWLDVTPTGGPAPVGTKLNFATQPTDTQTGGTISPVVVQIQNNSGQNAASNNVPITLTLSSGTGTLSGTTTQNTDASGKATFTGLSLNQAGAKQLTAAASGIGTGLTGTNSASFNITNAFIGSVLVFPAPPANTLAGQTITPAVTVQIQDGAGHNVSSNNVPVTLALTTGSGTLSGTTTQSTDASGKATFNDLNIDLTGTKELTASADGIGTGLASGNSGNFIITSPAVPTRLGFATPPPALAGLLETFTPQPVIVVLDQFDLPISNATDTVTVSANTGTLLGTATATANGINGRATFTDLRMSNQVTVTLTFTAAGLFPTNATVIVGPGTAVQLLFTTQPGGTITNNGTPFPQQPVIKTADRYGNLSTFNLPASLPVTLTNVSGVGTLSGTLTADLGSGALNGIWSPTGIAYTSGAGTQILAAVADWSSLGKAVLKNRWSFNGSLNDFYGGALGSYLGGEAGYTNTGGNTLLRLTGGSRYVDLGAGLVSSLSNLTVEVWATRRQSGSTINNQRYFECGGLNPNDPSTLTYFSVGPKLGIGTGGNCDAANRQGQGAGGWATTNAPVTDAMPTNSSSYFSAGNWDVLAQDAYLYQSVRFDPQNLAINCTSNLVPNCYSRVPTDAWPLSAINDTNCYVGRLIFDSPVSHFTQMDMDEIRIWEGQLDDAALTNHSAAGSAQVLVRNAASISFNLAGVLAAGRPTITNAMVVGLNFIASGTGGVASASYYVRTSPNAVGPLSSWGYLQTNNFDASGNFTFSTPYSSAESKKFFVIQIP